MISVSKQVIKADIRMLENAKKKLKDNKLVDVYISLDNLEKLMRNRINDSNN